MTDFQADPAVDAVRAGLAGRGATLDTPFGRKPFLYADYTASGRHHARVEAVLADLAKDYANPHTEDSATGRASNAWLREAEAILRRGVRAAADDCLLFCGAGATSAIHKLQEILGLAIPPASRQQVARVEGQRTVVFVGPYEHHSNELSWRESLAEVVAIGLTEEGAIDLQSLEAELADPRFEGCRKIGAFSAASNVTGVKTDVRALARLLHRHKAILCLDCAASAPYLPIDMHPDGDPEARIDAVYFSPHKFIGGPGGCGVLVFASELYRRDLPPTQCAGGTVRYVWPGGHDFLPDIEARERAGTPGLPQIVRSALAMQLFHEVGAAVIARREEAALDRAFERWLVHPRIDVLGPQDPQRRIGIVSFNLKDSEGAIVPPRLVTTLLNDVFGIQSRAGCSCAGPYGHALLKLDDATTQAIRAEVLAGRTGARPGWCRVSLHWAMDEAEVDYLVQAVVFLAEHAETLMPLYRCDRQTGQWRWGGDHGVEARRFPEQLLDEGIARRSAETSHAIDLDQAMHEARSQVEALKVWGQSRRA
ncbi:aminotransferase class V-fold PLP-dependent enzyme [Maricaulis sp. CAU 1757]